VGLWDFGIAGLRDFGISGFWDFEIFGSAVSNLNITTSQNQK
jgi:hypothetical protein